jgi:LacI family transcriptional regulator
MCTFFSTVINGIEQVANEHGYSVIICLSDDSFDKEVLNMEMLRMEVLMVLSCHFLRNQFRVFTILPGDQSRNAVVMFDRVTNILCDKVIIDDKHAAYEAVQSN